MGTLGELKSRILNEIKRPTLTAEVASAITDAIEFYAAKRFWFNEILDSSITTVAADPDYAVPPYLRRLILAEITIGGQRTDLYQGMEWDQYRYLMGGNQASGQPTDILFFGSLIFLYPTPADAYPLALTYCSALPPFADDASSNAWTTEAEPLIRARAKYDLFQNVIRDYAEAAEALREEDRWFGQLQTRDAGRARPLRVTPSSW